MNNFPSLSLPQKRWIKITTFFAICFLFLWAIHNAPLLIHLGICLLIQATFQTSILLAKKALSRTKLKNPVFIPNRIYCNLAITFLLLYIAAEITLAHNVSGFIAIGIGFIFIAKLKELHYFELFCSPRILCYYFMQLLSGCGYLWLGYNQINMIPSLSPLYLISCGYLLPVSVLVTIYPPVYDKSLLK